METEKYPLIIEPTSPGKRKYFVGVGDERKYCTAKEVRKILEDVPAPYRKEIIGVYQKLSTNSRKRLQEGHVRAVNSILERMAREEVSAKAKEVHAVEYSQMPLVPFVKRVVHAAITDRALAQVKEITYEDILKLFKLRGKDGKFEGVRKGALRNPAISLSCTTNQDSPYTRAMNAVVHYLQTIGDPENYNFTAGCFRAIPKDRIQARH